MFGSFSKSGNDATRPLPRVVIVGGGFGGLEVVRRLRRADVEITLVDRNNYHLFQPLLYQVGTGGLSPANIATPLRAIVGKQKNCSFVLGEVDQVDLASSEVRLATENLPFDYLVIAAGSSNNYFGHNEWAHFATGLKSLDDATAMRSRIFSAYEAAERTTDLELRQALMTFVVVGAGPTGVELAGALSEIARHTLKHDFRRIDPEDSRIVLLEAGDHVLSGYPRDLCEKAESYLQALGVEVRLRTKVTNIGGDAVEIESEGGRETIASRTVLWAAGVKANALAQTVAAASGAKTDRGGRIEVTERLNLPNYDNVFVIGDIAACRGEDGKPLPGIAPVAIQEGKYVGQRIAAAVRGEAHEAAFRYRDVGSMATIGRAAAIARIGRFKFSGWIAWLLWLAVHLVQIMEFPNRLLILVQWAWNYITFNRVARLITSRRVPPPSERASAGTGDPSDSGVVSGSGLVDSARTP